MCLSSDELQRVLNQLCRPKLATYWFKQLNNKPVNQLGAWLMKLIVVSKEGIYRNPSLFHNLLSAFFLYVTCNWSRWNEVEWPMFQQFHWYKSPNPLNCFLDDIQPPTVIRLNITPQQIQGLCELCLAAVREDLQQRLSPEVSHFLYFEQHGVVLRDGWVAECVKGKRGNPFFLATPMQGTQVHSFIHELRNILPYGHQNKGMLLVRVTNFQDEPRTVVSANETTPWHTDRAEYGHEIFALTLCGVSSLIWSYDSESNSHRTPYISVPDLPGSVVRYIGPIIRKPWVHMVPNSNRPRISVTWRPWTLADKKH